MRISCSYKGIISAPLGLFNPEMDVHALAVSGAELLQVVVQMLPVQAAPFSPCELTHERTLPPAVVMNRFRHKLVDQLQRLRALLFEVVRLLRHQLRMRGRFTLSP